MKTRYLILYFLICIVAANVHLPERTFAPYVGITYYIDNSHPSASNSNAGTTQDLPWLNIAKLEGVTLQPGDQVLIKAGTVYNQRLWIEGNGTSTDPITIGRYGTGANPKISGFTTLGTWTQVGSSSVWEITNAAFQTTVPIVLVNNAIVLKGRIPETGYYKHEGATTTSVTDAQLTANYVGAEIVERSTQWTFEVRPITGFSNGTISWTDGGTSYVPPPNYGYFIRNTPAALNSFGDYMYDPATKKLSMYFGPGLNPSSYTIKVATMVAGVRLNGKSYNTIQDIDIEGCEDNGIGSQGGTGNKLLRVNFTHMGRWAVRFFDVDGQTVDGCTFTDMMSNGIDAQSGCDGWTVKNNAFLRVGIYPGMGDHGVRFLGLYLSPDNQYKGIFLAGDGNTIEFNTFNNIGYVPIDFRGNNVIIRNNYINTHNFIKQDGGGIYTYTGPSGVVCNNPTFADRQVYRNTVINGVGEPLGTADSTHPNAHGLYLDEKSDNVDVHDNTILHHAGYGIFSHNGVRNNVHKNTIYDARGSYFLRAYDYCIGMFDNKIDTNYFFAKPGQYLIENSSDYTTNIYGWGTSNNNKFFTTNVNALNFSNNGGQTFLQWKTASGEDAASTINYFDPATILEEVNSTNAPVTRSLGGFNYTDGAGTNYPNTITLQPYQARVLLKGSAFSGGTDLKFHKLKR